MSGKLNRLRGRVFGWFDVKLNPDWKRSRLEMATLEDRVTPSFTPYSVPNQFLFDSGSGPLAAPARGTPVEIATAYLNEHAADFGLTSADLAGVKVTSSYTDADTGLGHVYLRQVVNGLEVHGADFNISIAANGSVIGAGGGFVPNLAAKLAGDTAMIPQMTPHEAVTHSIVALTTLDMDPEAPGCQCALCMGRGVEFKLPKLLTEPQTFIASNSLEQDSWVASEISLEPISARLHYVPTADGSAVLAWNLNIQTFDYNHWFDLSIDAATGDLRQIADWTDDAGYQVVPTPNEHPNDGGFAVLADPLLANASPFGWHDTNGVAGPEFTDTRGNNVLAQLDRDANNTPDTTPPRPTGGSSLDFSTYSYDTTLAPTDTVANQNAAVVNLFYVVNYLHDVTYQYGFTPAAGNFQTNNYGQGGSGNDAVNADAQDGSGTNNANFSTPVDGTAPRVQQYIWTAATPDRDSDLDNGIIHHEYGHGISNRLTGGPANSSALNNIQSGGMGEGWSDFFALIFTQRATDTQNGSYPIGNYSNNSTNGIRAYPYSFDMAIDPIMWDSYGTSGTTSYGLGRSTAVHRTGTVWSSTLWDMNWLLINKHGYDSDLSTGWDATPGAANAGNKLALQLVIDGLKLQPANPSFTQARDAILLADTNLTGGANHLQIWQAFARRGLGEGASVGASTSTTNIVNNTTIPAAVQTLQVTGHTPADQAILTTAPTSFTLNVTEPLNAGTVAAPDFTVNGIAATGVNYTAGSTVVTFTFATTPVTAQGLQTMELAAGAVTRASDANPIQAFAANFRFDSLKLTVTSTTPVVGATQAPPLTTFDLNLNEAVNPATVTTFDLVLSQGYATAVTFLNGNQTVRFTIAGLGIESALTARVNAGAFTDVTGNVNAAFAGTYSLDYVTRGFDTLAPVAPLGSAVYQGTMTGLVNTGADQDDFTIVLDAGQVLTATLDPVTGLRPRITLLSPTNAVLADVTAAANGTTITAAVPVAVAGTYTLRVRSAGSTTGTYSLESTLNAVKEAETLTAVANNTSATAQSLATGFITHATAGGSVSRATVEGLSDPGTGTTYSAAATAFAFEDISGNAGVNTILTNSDDVSTSFTIPFAFNFYDTDYSTIFVSDNGLITFGSGTTSNANSSLTSTPTQAALAVLWDDLETTAAGVKWQVLGTAGSRRLVVQWDNVRPWTSANSGTFTMQFQAVLFEGNNQIRLNYNNLNGGVTANNEGASATVGIKNQTSTSNLLLAQNVAGSTFHGTGKSTLITPTTPTGGPADYYSFTATAGQTVSLTLTGTADVTLVGTDGTTVLATGAPGPLNFGDSIANVVLPAAGTYFALVSGGVTPVDYNLSVVSGTADAEANDTAATAQPYGATRVVAGYLSAANDDWYTFVVPTGMNALTVETATPGDGTGQFTNALDPILRVYNATGTTLLGTGTALADGRNESLTVAGLTPGTAYTIRLTPAGSTVGEYIATVVPSLGAPVVQAVIINGGNPQRSRVLSLQVDFSDAVTIAPGAFSLTNGTTTLTSQPGGGLLTASNLVSGETVTTLTFDSAVAGVTARSLTDGIWTLTVNAGSVTGTTSGLTMAANSVTGNIRRLLGDVNADNVVDGFDLVLFGNIFGGPSDAFDFDDNGAADGSDLTVFGNRFGSSL